MYKVVFYKNILEEDMKEIIKKISKSVMMCVMALMFNFNANGGKVEARYTQQLNLLRTWHFMLSGRRNRQKGQVWATMFVKSSGADSPRQIKLRKKPSTGQWFLNDIQCLSDIKVPANLDPWA